MVPERKCSRGLHNWVKGVESYKFQLRKNVHKMYSMVTQLLPNCSTILLTEKETNCSVLNGKKLILYHVMMIDSN